MDKILLIDDDSDFTRFFLEVADLNGMSCMVVNESKDIFALDLNCFHHIIVDLMMPDFDGLQVIGVVIEVGYVGKVSVISGQDKSVLESVKEYCILNGFKLNQVLSKPCDLIDIEALLKKDFQPVPQLVSKKQNVDSFDVAECLLNALEKNEVYVVFQPKVLLNSEEVVGFEALARWTFDGVPVSPEIFIKAAEENGYINQLTRYIIKLSFSQFKKIRTINKNFTLAINFSALELSQTDLPDFVHQQAKKFEIPPHLITAEITETVFMEKSAQSLSTLTRFRLLGLKLSIDDFGTGYSSVNMLSDGPFNQLKIDRSFINKITLNEHSKIIVKSIIDMALELNMDVIAEGIEDFETSSMLLQLGVVVGQGYYYFKPLSSKEIMQKLIVKI